MDTLKTIVATLDLDAGSDAVLARAVQLAEAHGARLVVLHVIEAEPIAPMAAHLRLGDGGLRERLEREAIAAIAPLLGRAPGAEIRVEFGAPHEVIVRAARDLRADLVVLGPGKGHTLKDKWLGSTADRVIRAAPAPILVARGAVAAPYQRVAIAVDGSSRSAGAVAARAVAEARRLAPGAAAQLVHAVEIPLTFQQAMLRAGTSQGEMDRYREARARQAREELSAFQRSVGEAAALPAVVLDGDPGSALVRFSTSAGIDLLAVGTHGRGAAAQALLGSVARHVLAGAACDVLVVAGGQ